MTTRNNGQHCFVLLPIRKSKKYGSAADEIANAFFSSHSMQKQTGYGMAHGSLPALLRSKAFWMTTLRGALLWMEEKRGKQ